ncbi:MAG: hypothetical protein ACRYGM_07500 [Janthinobacterium lividum]
MAETTKSHKAFAQAGVMDPALLATHASGRKNAGPAGGLLIAVGCSFILWAVIAQVARMASWVLF